MERYMQKGKQSERRGPSITLGVVGNCQSSTFQEVMDLFEKLEDFNLIYLKGTTRRLWLIEY